MKWSLHSALQACFRAQADEAEMDLALDSSSAPESLKSESLAPLEVVFSTSNARARHPCPTCQVSCIDHASKCSSAWQSQYIKAAKLDILGMHIG